MEHTHAFTTLGIQMERTEAPGKPKLDDCYAIFPIKCSVVDSDTEEEWEEPHCGAVREHSNDVGVAVVYEGDPITLSEGAKAPGYQWLLQLAEGRWRDLGGFAVYGKPS